MKIKKLIQSLAYQQEKFCHEVSACDSCHKWVMSYTVGKDNFAAKHENLTWEYDSGVLFNMCWVTPYNEWYMVYD